jgi:uncharacterized protein (DUF1501 family)
MDRRHFLRSSIAAGVLHATGGLLSGANVAMAATFPPLNHRVFVNMMLFGCANFRHLMPPALYPNPDSFAYQYWDNNANVHGIAATVTDFEGRWNADYFHVNDGATQFGILNNCGWLKRMWDAGDVAIICNAAGGTDRNHEHCQLQMDQGDLTSGPNDKDRSGWGGRLAATAGGNVLALTKAPRYFCYGPDPLDPLSHNNSNLISAPDMRDLSLYRPPENVSATDANAIVSRSLESYYAAKYAEMNQESIYNRFIEHEASVRRFGGLVNERLASAALPTAVADLTTGALTDPYLGLQIQNLYDGFLCSDLIDMHVASLEYGSFDSHKNQKNMIEPMFEDLFGDGKALDALYQALPTEVAASTVLVLAGEFGRQLRANDDGGTDHGQGNSILLIGSGVQGGVYGDMFPSDESSRLNHNSPDINGLTSFEHIFGAACDWIVPGGGDIVFPRRATAALEPEISLQNLFNT